MKVKDIENIILEVYPSISKDYKSNAKVELFSNIFSRLNAIPADEEDSMAEYCWEDNVIFIYSDTIETEEDVIRALIHECVHSKQSCELHEAYYEIGLDYNTHPHEIEAEYEEEKWKKYKLNTITCG